MTEARINIDHDANGTLTAGQTYVLTCDVPGVSITESAHYKWKRNKLNLQSTDRTLSLLSLNLSDAGEYFCNVTDNYIIYSGNRTITIKCKLNHNYIHVITF